MKREKYQMNILLIYQGVQVTHCLSINKFTESIVPTANTL